MKQLTKKSILSVNLTSASCQDVLEYVEESLEKRGEKYYIVTPNPEIIMYAQAHPSFRVMLNNAQLALPDGIGVMIASKILGSPLHERITGVDLMEKLCSQIAKKPITTGFLGGRENIAELTAECLKKKYHGLQVAFAASEWDEKGFSSPVVNSARHEIDILFVAFGFPKQEEWIVRNLQTLPFRVGMGVGGAFDYLSGRVPRAPGFLRALGLEWLFRLMHQPWRAKRQLALIHFVLLVLKSRLIPQVE